MLLKDKVAIITGGSRGIGKAIVLEFIKEGANVAFNFLKSKEKALELKKQIEGKGARVLIFKQDVRGYRGMKIMVKKVKHHFGRLDIIVNNAGIARTKKLVLMKKRNWEDVLSTSLSGTFNLTQAALATFMKQKNGNVINISSIAGTKGLPRQVDHSTAKAGIIGFTKALAREIGSYNVRVNAIAPGYISTDMIKNMAEEHQANLFKEIPLGRFGRPQEVAKLAVFLASDEAKYITGQVITIDGGLSI
ncbi:MAG: 3-oxoacyl-ACP reductase FabG [Candidatus Omnitrophota bacterium]|nr:MAG: 3-oxoacyl-ACP reductase FabG [Candidatus Omnitrophota bacterium]